MLPPSKRGHGGWEPWPPTQGNGPGDGAAGQWGCQQLQEQRGLSHGKEGKVTQEQLLITRHAAERQEERVFRCRYREQLNNPHP